MCRVRASLLDNEIKILEQDSKRINGEKRNVEDRIKENNEKIKLNKQVYCDCALSIASMVAVRSPRWGPGRGLT
jgi:hypothetical protein